MKKELKAQVCSYVRFSSLKVCDFSVANWKVLELKFWSFFFSFFFSRIFMATKRRIEVPNCFFFVGEICLIILASVWLLRELRKAKLNNFFFQAQL